jgi:antiviral helicase SLH1
LKTVLGLTRDDVAADPHLGSKRHRLITEAGIKLAQARMINFDERSEKFTITDLGRIAARYYIRYATIDIFNQEFRPRMTEADVLAMLSRSTEVCPLYLFFVL